MDSKLRNKLLTISAIGLAIAGLIFLALTTFSDDHGSCLPAGLGCIVLSNLFTVLRTRHNKSE